MKRGKKPIYNWNRLLKPGRWKTLKHGVDFQCSSKSMQVMIRQHCINSSVRPMIKNIDQDSFKFIMVKTDA